MKKLVLVTLIFVLGMGNFSWAQEKGKTKIDDVKHITAVQAYKMLNEDPEPTFLIDTRSMAEYELVGHPPMAHNVPYKFWTAEGLKQNPEFIKDVAEKFKKTDRLIFISSVGTRSLRAAYELKNAGFPQVFNVLHGFEGRKVTDKDSPNYGQRRRKNGWQYDGLPYTYDLKDKFTYKLHKSCGCD